MPALPSSPIDPALERLQDLAAGDRALLAGRCPSLAEHLALVPDPRDPRGVRHTLTSLLLAAVAALLQARSSRRGAAAQAIAITRRVRPQPGGSWLTVTVYAITSLTVTQATPAQPAGWIRGHGRIEALHHIRDATRTLTTIGLIRA